MATSDDVDEIGSEGATVHPIPDGGTANQIIVKQSSEDFDQEWETPTTDLIEEGTNLYFTDARAVSALTGATLLGSLSFSNASSGQSIQVTPTGDTGASSSTGGAVNMDVTGTDGAGLVIYSNNGASANGHLANLRADHADYDKHALFIDYRGATHAVNIDNTGTGSNSAYNLTSTNENASAWQTRGHEASLGTAKITHVNPSQSSGSYDTNATGLSVDVIENPAAPGTGTAAQGIYVDSTTGTTGNLLRLRNQSSDRFVVDSSGSLDIGSNGLNTTFTKVGNTSGDEFFVGTNGAFRVQRSAGGSETWRVQIDGDSEGRLLANSSGVLSWGNGTAAQDTNLYRSAGDTLKTDDAFDIGGTLSVALETSLSRSLTIEAASFQPITLTRFVDNANGQGLRFIKSRGTSGTPAGIQSSDQLSRFMATGYIDDGSLPTTGVHEDFLTVHATQNWTSTARGREVRFRSVPNDGISAVDRLIIRNDGTTEVTGDFKHTGSNLGFFSATPSAQDTGWSVTNVATTKTYDAAATTTDEIADVLGTLIDELKAKGMLGG